MLRTGGEHLLECRVIQSGGRLAKGETPLPGEFEHRAVGLGIIQTDHARACKRFGVAGDEVEDVAVIVPVPDHLDQVDAHVADRPAVAEIRFRRESGMPEVFCFDAGGQGITREIVRPDVDVGVDDPVRGCLF